MNEKWSIDRLQDAWQIATRLHSGQTYGGQKDGEKIEYINHIGSVVFEIMNAASRTADFDAELGLTCAMLHDTIEDTEMNYADVAKHFGVQVAEGVLSLTKDPAIEDKQEKMLDSLRRIKAQPKEIWAVKMADRICNLYAPPYYWTMEKKAGYRNEAQLIWDHLNEANKYLSDRLREKIIDYGRFLSS